MCPLGQRPQTAHRRRHQRPAAGGPGHPRQHPGPRRRPAAAVQPAPRPPPRPPRLGRRRLRRETAARSSPCMMARRLRICIMRATAHRCPSGWGQWLYRAWCCTYAAAAGPGCTDARQPDVPAGTPANPRTLPAGTAPMRAPVARPSPPTVPARPGEVPVMPTRASRSPGQPFTPPGRTRCLRDR
jgi:hypothetical protein